MEAVGQQTVVEVEVSIQARPETIFGFLIEPEKMTRWMGSFAELDTRPNGVFRVGVTGDDIANGAYLEVTPYERVVFSFGWEGERMYVAPGSSTVEITLIPDGASTRVRLIHSGLGELTREDHRKGWTYFLDRLAIAAAGGDPGPQEM